MPSPIKRARPGITPVAKQVRGSPVHQVDPGAPDTLGRGESPVGVDARRLQAAVEERYRLPPPPGKWSARRRLVFILMASTVLWGLLIGGAVLIVRAISA